MTIGWIAPGKADDCTSAKEAESDRATRAFDTKLSELATLAAGGATNVNKIERRLKTLQKAALKQIGRAARACARDKQTERISRVADLYISKRLPAALPADLRPVDPRSLATAEVTSEGSVALPDESRRQAETPAASAPQSPQGDNPGKPEAKLDAKLDAKSDVTAKAKPEAKPETKTEAPRSVPDSVVAEARKAPDVPARAPPASDGQERPRVAGTSADEPQANEALQELAAGRVTFDHPEDLQFDHAQSFHAKLSSAPLAGVAADMNVGKRIAATLRGGDGFKISPAEHQTQWLNPRDAAEWRWEITPKSLGRQVLTLTLEAVTTIGGKDTLRPLRTVTYQVDVGAKKPGWSSGDLLISFKAWLDRIGRLWPIILLLPIFLILRRLHRALS